MKCIRNLSISQLLKLSQRFDLNPQYKNPRKRKIALRRCLREYWKNHSIGECSICWEQIEPNKLCVTPCAHLFCNECLLPYVRQTEKCPLCRATCSYTNLLNKIIKIPEVIAFLKNLVEISQRELTEEEEPIEEFVEEPIEESHIIYHINIYLIAQRGLDNIYTCMTVFAAMFIAYYYYLFLTRGLDRFVWCMNGAIMFGFIYYMMS